MSTTGSGSGSLSAARSSGATSSPEPDVTLRTVTYNGHDYFAKESVLLLLWVLYDKCKDPDDKQTIRNGIEAVKHPVDLGEMRR